MKEYLKSELKHLPFTIVLFVLLYGITAFATGTTLFASSEVSYDNTTTGIQSNKVQGAIDELYACASNYGAYNTRLTNTENTIGTGSLTTTSQTLISGINELNNNSGVTAGTYGPSANVNGANGNTISVPQITVNAKGKITSISNKTYTSVNTDTNTWRGIQNNLTSSSTSDCLSAAQGKALNDSKLNNNKIYKIGNINASNTSSIGTAIRNTSAIAENGVFIGTITISGVDSFRGIGYRGTSASDCFFIGFATSGYYIWANGNSGSLKS